MRDDIKEYPGVAFLVEKVIRSFEREEGRGIREKFSEFLTDIELITPSGVFAGMASRHEIQKERYHEFVERLLRGMFFHVFGQRVPNAFRVTPNLSLGFNSDIQPKFVTLLGGSSVESVGGGIFSYAWAEMSDSPLSSVWLMSIFDRLLFGGLIVNPTPPPGSGVGNP